MKILSTLLLLLSSILIGMAQETFPSNGATDNRHIIYAFTNAKIHVDYQTVIEKGTLLIKDGKILEVGSAVSIPKDAVVSDLKGKSVYPSFIDVYSSYGMPAGKKSAPRSYRGPQMESNTKGAYGWNEAIKPETSAGKLFTTNKKDAEALRKHGFGAVMSFQQDGIARGTSVLVSLADERENKVILKSDAAAMYSFSKGSSKQNYPSSQMGSIALLRQTYYDAKWYAAQGSAKETNLSLAAWNGLQNLPQIFEVSDALELIRADKVGDEFGVQYIIKGSGDEYQRLDEVKATKANIILPLSFPAPYDVEDIYDAPMVSLAEMKHWELAALNPAALEKAGIPFALTAHGHKDKKTFWKNVHKAIAYGLSEKQALKALTWSPAEFLGVQQNVGALKKGMVANFLICSGNIFDKDELIFENWIQGQPYVLADKDAADIRGDYKMTVDGLEMQLKISGKERSVKAKLVKDDSVKTTASVKTMGALFSMSYSWKGDSGLTRLSGNLFATQKGAYDMKGSGEDAMGKAVKWSATLEAPYKEKPDTAGKETKENVPSLDQVIYPFVAYGRKKSDTKAGNILIKNARVWTNEKEGILDSTDVYLSGGKISKVGKNLEAGIRKALGSGASSLTVIDGTGKHLTPGIIDEHSHLAISKGVNEGSQASSAEVSIADVVNSEDINIYRNLAGGVVAAQLLHGSANPIGGQSALVKFRWGKSPEEMKIKGADGFIKFALGENVKQSNWGDLNTVRFPQTRMGVEQVYYDHFIRAREYDQKKKSGKPYRKDIELEALSEILNKKRFITCHSYVQSEINMLMHVGDSMGFRVNTFTHILEGYKVADKMKAHGAGGSTFSDWWAYKMEVKEAIPYNPAIMHKMGVVTAINSDDREMSRRLNQEAAKSVKYGGLSEEDALKLVTLNPAKLLHLDKDMGSIKVGKSADVVLWTDHPLSVYAKADKTLVDGIVYFDSKEDLKMRESIHAERTRLIQAMIKAKKGGSRTQKPAPKEHKQYSCHEDWD